jgi:hypothetical protein
MVEHATVNRRVEGSSPSSGAISILRKKCLDVFGGNGEIKAFRFLNIPVGLQNVITYIGIDADNSSFVI